LSFSEIAVNDPCEVSDSNQCADPQTECRDDNGYKCLCKDTSYLKDHTCAPRMQFIFCYTVSVPVNVGSFTAISENDNLLIYSLHIQVGYYECTRFPVR
jgi:hypothetical protein